jgi:ubiquinone/menaquinone biosynthesis C-methylase UbiE
MLHRRAVDRLAPEPGQSVLDVGCGTGLSFELIEEGIGPAGRLVGVELSPEMLEQMTRSPARRSLRSAGPSPVPTNSLLDSVPR